MPTYIVLARLTAQAKRNQAEAMKARDQSWAEFRKQGFKITAYMTLGQYDAINIVEAPSEELMMKFLTAAGARGNVETTTLRAFTQPEYDKIQGS